MVKDIDREIKAKKKERFQPSVSGRSGSSTSSSSDLVFSKQVPRGKFDSYVGGMRRMQNSPVEEFPIGPKVGVKVVVDNSENDDNFRTGKEMNYWDEKGISLKWLMYNKYINFCFRCK